MLIWIPVTIVVFTVIGIYLSIRRITTIPVFIDGLIPGTGDASMKVGGGTTVYIVYLNDDETKGDEIFRGFADNFGIVETSIATENAGRRVLIRWRHAGYKPKEFEMMIPKYGIIHTVEMTLDSVYSGQIRGKPIHDLVKHYQDAVQVADSKRQKFIQQLAHISGHPFARIPVAYWLVFYVALIVSSTFDYWANPESFEKPLTSIAHAMYFSIVTITTLGYGDSHPTTDLLRIGCSIEALVGVFILGFALNSMYRGPDD